VNSGRFDVRLGTTFSQPPRGGKLDSIGATFEYIVTCATTGQTKNNDRDDQFSYTDSLPWFRKLPLCHDGTLTADRAKTISITSLSTAAIGIFDPV
jgi:hypothetical protein